MTLSGTTPPGLNGFGSNSHEGVLRILLSSIISRVSLSYCSVSYNQNNRVVTPLQMCIRCILLFQPTGPRVDLGVMAMKEYSIVLRYPELKLYYQIHFTFLPRWSDILVGRRVLFLCYGYSQCILNPVDSP